MFDDDSLWYDEYTNEDGIAVTSSRNTGTTEISHGDDSSSRTTAVTPTYSSHLQDGKCPVLTYFWGPALQNKCDNWLAIWIGTYKLTDLNFINTCIWFYWKRRWLQPFIGNTLSLTLNSYLGKIFIFDTKNDSTLMNITVQTTSAVTAGHCIYCSFRRQKFVRGKLSSSHCSTFSHSHCHIGYSGSCSWCERI